MPSVFATLHLETTYPRLEEKEKSNILEAFDMLKKKLPNVEPVQMGALDKLCDIEMINPSYFPRLSCAAARTFCALHKANSKLTISFLLKLVEDLAQRGRPWESLDAFERIATSCPSQITADNIAYLRKLNSNILEISSYSIEEKVKASYVSRLPLVSSFFAPDLRQEVANELKSLGYRAG